MKNYLKRFMVCFVFVLTFLAATMSVNAESKLMASIKFTKQNAVKVSWNKVPGAEGYDVFFAAGKANKFSKKPAESVKKTSVVIRELNKKDVSDKNAYKAKVQAYKMENGKKVVIAESYPIRVAGAKCENETNIKSISVSGQALKLEEGKTSTIQVKYKKESKKKDLSSDAAPYTFYSDNEEVATVDKNGNVTAVKAGNATIYVVAQNGLYQKVAISVPEVEPETETEAAPEKESKPSSFSKYLPMMLWAMNNANANTAPEKEQGNTTDNNAGNKSEDTPGKVKYYVKWYEPDMEATLQLQKGIVKEIPNYSGRITITGATTEQVSGNKFGLDAGKGVTVSFEANNTEYVMWSVFSRETTESLTINEISDAFTDARALTLDLNDPQKDENVYVLVMPKDPPQPQ